MTKRKIVVEFDDDNVTDARALTRAIQYAFEASRVGEGSVFIEGFSMNPTDKWLPGDFRIDIVDRT